jgi:hypothetical protein
MADTINIDNAGTSKQEHWITIKDASDLLGTSERHTWRIVQDNHFKTQKMLNQDRKKTYVLREDVEKFYHAEKERHRLEELKRTPISDKSDIHDMSDIKGKFDMSDIGKASMSDIGKMPILMSDYRNILLELQKQQTQLIKREAVWRITTICVTVSTIAICSVAGLYIFDSRKAMSDIKTEMSDIRRTMSDKEKAMSDIITKAQTDLTETKDALYKRDLYINRLEQSLPKEKIDELKTGERRS